LIRQTGRYVAAGRSPRRVELDDGHQSHCLGEAGLFLQLDV
jgi:hypothetical protein